MAKNLNYSISDSWCYDNNDSNCNKYGRLYTFKAAQIACPNGWRLPTRAELETLILAYGDDTEAYKELVDSGSSGFNFKLVGQRSDPKMSGGIEFGFMGVLSDLWSSIVGLIQAV